MTQLLVNIEYNTWSIWDTLYHFMAILRLSPSFDVRSHRLTETSIRSHQRVLRQTSAAEALLRSPGLPLLETNGDLNQSLVINELGPFLIKEKEKNIRTINKNRILGTCGWTN